MTSLRQVLEDERFKYERLEEQMNDMTELNQNEFSNLRQVCLLTIDSELSHSNSNFGQRSYTDVIMSEDFL